MKMTVIPALSLSRRISKRERIEQTPVNTPTTPYEFVIVNVLELVLFTICNEVWESVMISSRKASLHTYECT